MSDRHVSVVVVTYDSAEFIESCLEAVAQQTRPPAEIVVVDNNSADDSVERVRRLQLPIRVIRNQDNIGFAAAHNQGIRSTTGDYYLALNPDVVMEPLFIEELVKAFDVDPLVGSVSGRLLRSREGDGKSLIDSTGIYMTPSLRHLDRGSGEIDRGQYSRPEYVFGVSGAAAMYRRRMLEAVSIEDEIFDEDFFAYREDADLAWRAQLLAWKALYTPHAVAFHRRRVTPERRRTLPAVINMHSVKNRFMLRIKNQTLVELIALFVPSSIRDLQVIAYVVLWERSSLPGLVYILRHFFRIWSKRKLIMAGRTTSGMQMLRWFRYRPVAFPLGSSN